MRSLWAKTGLTSDQSSHRILQDQDDKRIPIAIGVWTATTYKASIKLKRCSDKKFKRNLAAQFCINLFPDLWGFCFLDFGRFGKIGIAHRLVPDPNVTAKLQENVDRSLQLRSISEFCGLGCYIRETNRIPDPLTVLLILIPRLVIPDPVAVIPDPIYLVTTLILARQVQNSAARINSDRIKNKKKIKVDSDQLGS